MKKTLAILLALMLVCTCGITAFAAGIDDGTLSVAEKDGKKFFGTKVSEGCVEYVAADGSGETFYDLTGDKKMNICDLVALVNGQVDLDNSGTYDKDDAAALRLMLIGGAN